MARDWCRLLLGALLALQAVAPVQANERMEAAPPDIVEAGTPSFVVYAPESLGLSGAPTDLKQLPDGRILVVAQRDLAIGDGVRWEVIRQTEDESRYIAHDVAVGQDGHIYVGVKGCFAKIDFGTDGHWRFAEVAGPPPGGEPWAELYNAEPAADNWYWHSASGNLYEWDLSTQPRLVGSVKSAQRIFSLGRQVFFSDFSDGSLMRLDEAGITCVIPPEATNTAEVVTASVPFDDQTILTGTNGAGLRLFDGKTFQPFVEHGPLSGKHRIADLCATTGEFFAAAVDTVGIVFFDRTGRIVQILDKSLDHRLARPQRLCYAKEGVLWVTLNNGVARIEFPARLSHYETMIDTGLNYVEPVRHQGRLWILASGQVLRGLYSDDRRLVGFEKTPPSKGNVFKLAEVAGRLIASTDDALYAWADDHWTPIVENLPHARIAPQSETDGRWVYAARNEIGWIGLRSDPVTLERIPAPGLGDTYGLVQDATGIVWLELGTARLARIDPRRAPLQPEIFDSQHGIPNSWAALHLLDGVARITCNSQTLRYDETTGRFAPDAELHRRYPMLVNASSRPMRDSFGRIWYNRLDRLRIVEDTPAGPRFSTEKVPQDITPIDFFDDTNGVVWMHDRRRLSRFDPSMPLPEATPLRAVLTRIDLPGSNRTLFMPGEKLPPLDFRDNSLAAHFVAPSNPFGQPITFEFMMEGLGTKWVSTGNVGTAVFNRLDEGKYALYIRPKVGDTPGEITRLEFIIRPPWYRSPIAYASYGITILGGLALAILLPVYFERRQTGRLEQLVSARTAELHETNRLLDRQIKETLQNAAEFQASEEQYRHLSEELEHRVEERTEELKRRVAQVEQLNIELHASQEATDRFATSLQEANANLLAANHELEAFSYSVSHDLRAPLRNITGFIELLQKRLHGKGDAAHDRYLDIVITETKRMGTLIDDLLAFSRIGRAELKWQTVLLKPLVEQVKQELAIELADRPVEWIIQEMPPVLGDPALLRQVVANLVGNAVKFTRHRTPARIEIGTHPAPTPDRLAFFVKDNGEGFNPQYQDKLFRVFQRLHSTRDFEGTGIGLANVKRIITRHGGTVWAEGQPGQGATFHFTLRPAPKK